MSEWIKEFGRIKAFTILFSIMIILMTVVLFYFDYHMNHFIYEGEAYSLDGYYDYGWHLVSENDNTIKVSEADGKRYFTPLSDLTISIDEKKYEIYHDMDLNLFIDVNGKTVNVKRIYDLIISNGETKFSLYLIILYIFIVASSCMFIIVPEQTWKTKMKFVTKGGEPTEFYLGVTRLTGVAILIITLLYPLILV